MPRICRRASAPSPLSKSAAPYLIHALGDENSNVRESAEHALCLDVNFLARRRLFIPDNRKSIKWDTLQGELAWADVFLGEDPDCPMLFVDLYRHAGRSPDTEQFGIRRPSIHDSCHLARLGQICRRSTERRPDIRAAPAAVSTI